LLTRRSDGGNLHLGSQVLSKMKFTEKYYQSAIKSISYIGYM